MSWPRVLLVAIGRVNAADAANNGLLLRNLLAGWPRGRLAQIYSSGGNGDGGYCGSYYKLGPGDRRLGRLFYRLRGEAQGEGDVAVVGGRTADSTAGGVKVLKTLAKRVVVDTGLYELLFEPRVSKAMLAWAKAFAPELLFAQGYSYAFATLPLLLCKELGVPIVYYPTDDWPKESYRAHAGGVPWVSGYVARAVASAAGRLVEQAAVRIAFNKYMQEEYRVRYGREFAVLMHGDESRRFVQATPRRLAAADECWIVTTGAFNEHRLPLLADLDRACELLRERGVRARGTVLPVRPLAGGESARFRHLTCVECPGHEELAGVLRAADVLFLPERFDETADGIRLSVSSKAHLFMFAGKPIVVYSDARTGVARYAREDGWAAVVAQRDPALLATTIEAMYRNREVRDRYVAAAQRTAEKNHCLPLIQESFRSLTWVSDEKEAEKLGA